MVLGAGLAGLFAARVLSKHADSVVVVERDVLPTTVGDRRGVPQGRHAHALLCGGQAVLESLFPGISAELQAQGATVGSLSEQRWLLHGRPLSLRAELPPAGFMCSRPLLEHCVRARVGALENVVFREGVGVSGLLATGGQIEGVLIGTHNNGADPEALSAELTVDASGRGSKLPMWLAALGYPPPEEERVRVGVRYASVVARRNRRDVDGAQCVVVTAAPPNRRCGVAIAIDADRWLLTLQGYLGEHVGSSWRDLLEFARGLPSGALHDLMRDSEPLSEVVTATFPYSRYRRYDRLARHPDGVLALGDAYCSFNPIFAQGMTLAALASQQLEQVLQTTALPQTWRPFYARCKTLFSEPWAVAAGNDQRFAELQGPRTRTGELLSRYMDRLTRVATGDPEVAAAFLYVAHMLAPSASLLRPKILWRVARGPFERS